MILVPVPWLPSVKGGFTTYAITISPFVFILNAMKDNKAIIAHEQVHLDQVAEMGWFKFYWNYIFDVSFREKVEMAGYEKQKEVENA